MRQNFLKNQSCFNAQFAKIAIQENKDKFLEINLKVKVSIMCPYDL